MVVAVSPTVSFFLAVSLPMTSLTAAFFHSLYRSTGIVPNVKPSIMKVETPTFDDVHGGSIGDEVIKAVEGREG